jgi:uncharacterized protein
MMSHISPSEIDTTIRQVLSGARVIAVVGLSQNTARPSYGVAAFLQQRGYRIVPVNPGQAGSTLLGETVYADLASIPPEIAVDMVDIFRSPDAVPGIVAEAIANLPALKAIWMQIGVGHAGAAATARSAGLAVVEDRCPKIEIPRLGL